MIKPLLFLCLLNMLVSSKLLSQHGSIPDILLRVKNTIEPEQYELGLALAEIQIVNSTKTPLRTSSVFWEMLDEQTLQWQSFGEGAEQDTDYYFGPYGVKTIMTNLNLAAIGFDSYKKTNSQRIKKNIRAAVSCRDDRQTYHYYSEVITIIINPLNTIDKSALLFLQKSGINPYAWANKHHITHGEIQQVVLDSLVNHFPKSTFTTLAQLTQAYHKAAASPLNEEGKEKVLALLVKPLLSRFSYMRYLAEELSKL